MGWEGDGEKGARASDAFRNGLKNSEYSRRDFWWGFFAIFLSSFNELQSRAEERREKRWSRQRK